MAPFLAYAKGVLRLGGVYSYTKGLNDGCNGTICQTFP